ncbi:MAG: hypothetical protein PHE21_01135 [Candidatus Dojkabacteria bacterium]|nr:hypothetical protein [Candidatus Dojkabacteria bacterium]
MRDRQFLEDIMYDLWDNYFCDIPRKNMVVIKYGKYSKRQLGSIKLANGRTKIKGLVKNRKKDFLAQDDRSITVITITRYFQNDIVPEFVIRATIAHEMCHYAHGFSSPLEKRFAKPHQGRIIDKELEYRGLRDITKQADLWLKDNWVDIVYS